MKNEDKEEFSNKMTEMATVLGRPIDREDISAYFNQLKDYPIEVLIKAIDQALQDRDPEDEFMRMAIITLPEILVAIKRISAKQLAKTGDIAGCKECGGKGWVTTEDEGGTLKARPCRCLYQIARNAIAIKKKPSLKEAGIRRHAEEIVNAYELYIIKEENKNESSL